jgi:hypothetical protein
MRGGGQVLLAISLAFGGIAGLGIHLKELSCPGQNHFTMSRKSAMKASTSSADVSQLHIRRDSPGVMTPV